MNAFHPNRKLLVLDDEADFAELVCDVGSEAGLCVAAANDFSQFTDQYTDDLDVIVLDLSMPDSDGIELTRWLSDRGYGAHLILMSGVDKQILESTREIAAKRGLNVIGALQKPVSIDELESLLCMPSDDSDRRSVPAQRKTFADEEIVSALRSGAINPHYQPKISLGQLACDGVEALARWTHPVHGILGPDTFLPRLLALGHSDELASCMFSAAADDLADLRRDGFDVKVALNVEGEQLADSGFPDRISDIVTERGLKPADFVLEVTEHGVVERLFNTIENVLRLRLRGFSVSIDDYGTGHSTMSQLQRLPFSELKIDKSFVDRLPGCAKSRSIVASTIELAHRLGLNVVAEGVETPAQSRTLAEMGCTSIQGFLLARPMNIGALRDFLTDGIARLSVERLALPAESRFF
ncbi:MAG: EAL domain-containing response regulator [Pseudomonadota bacterium]|nr:EAL domain-containing response regulator [Pseudomonadota bacterium]